MQKIHKTLLRDTRVTESPSFQFHYCSAFISYRWETGNFDD